MIDPRPDPRHGDSAQLEGGHWQLVGRAESHPPGTFDSP